MARSGFGNVPKGEAFPRQTQERQTARQLNHGTRRRQIEAGEGIERHMQREPGRISHGGLG
eukprot:1883462-Prorocentrum_lima.AAC.1